MCRRRPNKPHLYLCVFVISPWSCQEYRPKHAIEESVIKVHHTHCSAFYCVCYLLWRMILDFFGRFGTSVSHTSVKQSEQNDSPCDRTSIPFLQVQLVQEKLFLLITEFWELFILSISKIPTSPHPPPWRIILFCRCLGPNYLTHLQGPSALLGLLDPCRRNGLAVQKLL